MTLKLDDYTKEKKRKGKRTIQNLKVENCEKRNGLEIWWIGNFQLSLAWIHAAVSE